MKTYRKISDFIQPLTILAAVSLPMVSLADTTNVTQVKTFKDLVNVGVEYLAYIIPFISILSVVVFLWGIYKYFIQIDSDKKEAGNFLLYSVIGFFVMISFWGLVNILHNTIFGTDATALPTLQLKGGSSTSGSLQSSSPYYLAPSGSSGVGSIQNSGSFTSGNQSSGTSIFGTQIQSNGSFTGSMQSSTGSSGTSATQNGSSGTTGSTGSSQKSPSTGSGTTATNPFDPSIAKLQNNYRVNGCVDASGNPGPNSASSSCASQKDTIQQLQKQSDDWNTKNTASTNDSSTYSNGYDDDQHDDTDTIDNYNGYDDNQSEDTPATSNSNTTNSNTGGNNDTNNSDY